MLEEFRTVFTAPTWNKGQVVLCGTLLARGRRTVTAALRQMGRSAAGDFSLSPQTLNRAVWSARELSRRLLLLLVKTFGAAGGGVTLVIDDHLERRWGRKIRQRGHYRDRLLSSKAQSVSTSGLRWIVLAVVVSLPWTSVSWALPVVSVLAPTPEVSARLGRRHKTVGQWARQLITLVRRWVPDVPLTLIGDGAYSVVELGVRCAQLQVTLIAPLRLDACLHAPPLLSPGQIGRPRKIGPRLPSLGHVLGTPQTRWQSVRVAWYGNRQKRLELASGTALWYRSGVPPLPIRWVLVRDPAAELEPKAYFSTAPQQAARTLVQTFVKRWTIEVTFEESRAHLGIETQRQWAELAIERTTPCLLGLYSLIPLLAHALHPDGQIPITPTAWYPKQAPTFADVLAVVRRSLWNNFHYSTSAIHPDMVFMPKADLARLAHAVCYAH